MKYILVMLLFVTVFLTLNAQEKHSLYGEVRDKLTNEPIPGAIVAIESLNLNLQTDNDGHFHFVNLFDGECTVKVSFMGYIPISQMVTLNKKTHVEFLLENNNVGLTEVTITSDTRLRIINPTILYNQAGIIDIASPNFTKMLATVAGVSSMDIGAGISKPIIRGLGFNRIAVVDRGITQQNQQWGADHGLEINQFDLDRVTVHKGAKSLEFGSDAMAGAIEIAADKPQGKNKYESEAVLYGASNNDLVGIALMNQLKHDNWFFKLVGNVQSFGDYRVPADNFNYLYYNFPIYDKRLKNTAGKENNLAGTVRYDKGNFSTSFNVSNNFQKVGFFPGAHGLPDISSMNPDGNFRNIDLPYSTANHFRVINNTELKLHIGRLLVNTGYQDNHRQEHSYFHTHYQNQVAPEKNPTLELDFRLKTYSLNAHLYIDEKKDWKKTIGISSEYQQNRIGGYSFFLPEFSQFANGIYTIHSYTLNNEWELSGGVRYDVAKMDITGFYDYNLAENLANEGHSPEEITTNAQRAYDTNRNFGSFSGSVGVSYRPCHSNSRWRANVSKSFRFPTANELASNGVHHGAFRYEQGNPNLNPEESYAFDIDYSFLKNDFQLEVSPFVNYYSNYIYLNPLAEFSIIQEAGQMYEHTEAEAMFSGAEYTLNYDFVKYNKAKVSILTKGAYVYNRNITSGYPLPFTPPLTLSNEITYQKSATNKNTQFYRFAFEHKWFADQNRVVQNEDTTPGASLFNLSAGIDYKWNKFLFQINLQVQNIFDTHYMNHLSFYRKLNIPEPGRNIQLFIRIPFNK